MTRDNSRLIALCSRVRIHTDPASDPRKPAPVTIASTLDPPPAMPSMLSMLGDALVLCAFAYIVTLGLATIAAAVLR